MKRIIAILLLAAALATLISCNRASGGFDIRSIKTYKDIPGVEQQEIDAIESLRITRTALTYGQMNETEAFLRNDGSRAGFAAKFCDFLTDLFGIEFTLRLYDWETLKNGIDTARIDFTGDLTPTPDRMQQYYMTHPIAERSLRVFTYSGASEILHERDLDGRKVGSLAGTIDIEHVKTYYPELSFTVVEVESFEKAAEKLKTREIDAFVTEGVIDPLFDSFGDINSKELFPLVYTPVSLTTINPELKPIIDIVNKYLSAGGIDVLYDFYKQGNYEYAGYKLEKSFTDREKEYIYDHISRGVPVNIALEQDNYPICFYNKTDKEFQGIAVDVIAEVSSLTGLTFEVVNDENTPWSEILDMLRDGRAAIVSQLLHSAEREGYFLWSAPYASDYYSLLSNFDYPTLASYQVVRARVGTIRSSAFEDKYNEWFPDNSNLILYDDQIAVLDALEDGEIELLMGSNYLMLMQQNYREKPGFKINVKFNTPMESYFGFNINEGELCSIINKAQFYVNTSVISDDWTSRGYDYSRQLARQRLLIFAAVALVLTFGLFLTIFWLIRKRKQNLALDRIVQERTVELEEALQEEEAANKAKSAFLSTMSHEIRTPMNAILGITEIQLQNTSLDVSVKEALGKLYSSGDLLLGIINDILDLSKIEAGKLELIIDKYEIASLVSDTAQLNMMRIGSKPIEFELRVDERLPALLMGDELRVKQIMNNLLSNAFKYTERGTVELSITSEGGAGGGGAGSGGGAGGTGSGSSAGSGGGKEATLVIHVSDTGQGMTQEQVSKLFDEYSRFNMEANRTTEGTGLGMSITRNLVKLMNGEISVQSEPGKGSVFTVKLPQEVIGDELLGSESAENLHLFRTRSRAQMKRVQVTREPMPYGSVLIVDDVETNIYVAKGLMSPYELKIDSASSGFEAIEKIKAGNVYDIVFMDHMMPKMDGIEATSIIRGEGYTNPIVALTANAVAGQADIFLHSGFDDFISKPIDVRQLNTILNNLIRDKQTPETLEAAREAAANNEAQGAGDEAPQGIDPEFAKVFVRDAKKALALLDAIADKGSYGNEEDLRSYVINVHGMKSALANVKETGLSETARKLEEAGREKKLDYIEAETQGFLASLKAFIESLAPSEESANAATADEDPEFLNTVLVTLKEACEQYDGNTAENLLAELKGKTWSQATSETLEKIAEHLLHSDFDEATALIDAFAAK